MSDALVDQVFDWQVPTPAVAVYAPGRELARAGAVDVPLRVASISKVLAALAALVAVEEGALELDDPAGPEGSTVRHLLAHTSGYGFDVAAGVIGAPGARRVYSNRGYDELAAHVARATGIAFDEYLHEAVLAPLAMTSTTLRGSAAFAVHSTVEDLGRLALWLLDVVLERPGAVPVLDPASVLALRTVAFAGVEGVMPGVGRFTPLDWGLGPDLNFGRAGHWAGPRPSRSAFGHFGGSGTFLIVDPAQRLAAVYLGDRDFGGWALEVWPPFVTALWDTFA